MKRSSFFASLVALLCAVMTQMTAQALELTVHDGTATNSSVPFYGIYYDNSIRAQMVFSSFDLTGMNGASITSIKWYTTNKNAWDYTSHTIIYLKEVDYTAISAYESTNSCTIVYGGTISRVAGDTTGTVSVTFDTPFTYNGGNLLIGVENTDGGGVWGSMYFYGEGISGASIGGYHASTIDGVPAYQQNFLPKTTFTYVPTYTVTGLPTDNATVTTNGVAAVVGAGGTLTGLSTNVTVKATPADGYQFTAFTAARTSPLSISYKLTDSYGDGWNGSAAIQVVDNDTETVITNLTLKTGSLLEGTLPVADGANLRFQWKAGWWDSECAYEIKGVNGEVVLVGEDALAAPVVYNVTSAVAVTENPDGSRFFTMPNDDVAVACTITTTTVISNYNDWVQVNSATVGGTGLWYETKSGTANGLCYIFNKAPGTTSGIFSTAKVGSDQVVTTPASPRTDAGFKVKIRASDDPLGTVNVKYYDVSSTGNTVLTGEGAAPTRFFCLVTTLDSYGPGDLDGDGKYTANDTAIINNYILYRALGASTPRFAQFDLSPAAMAAADVDGNGVVDGTDMALIQKGVEDMSVYSGN